MRGSGALKTTFEDWAHASAFLFRTFEDQWRLLAFEAFEKFETSADYHPLQPTRYVRNPGIPGVLGFLESWDCTSRADLATSPLSCPHAEVYGPPCARARQAAPKPPFEDLSADRVAAAFETFKDIGARSLKMMPWHHFKTFKDLGLEGTTFKPR